MATDKPLTPRQARFVAEYSKDLNGTQAAIRSGYSPKTATMQAARLLTKDNVRSKVDTMKAEQIQSADLSARRVLEELRRLAFCDPRAYFDDAGKAVPLRDLTEEQAAAVAGYEVIVKNAQAGDGHQDIVHKVKLVDKTRALESLAKHFGLLIEKVEHSGGLDISWKDSE